jgi:hypothetical protein
MAAPVIMEATPTQNPQTVWQININGEKAYRGHRISSLSPWDHMEVVNWGWPRGTPKHF